jgi:hypothetical protein
VVGLIASFSVPVSVLKSGSLDSSMTGGSLNDFNIVFPSPNPLVHLSVFRFLVFKFPIGDSDPSRLTISSSDNVYPDFILNLGRPASLESEKTGFKSKFLLGALLIFEFQVALIGEVPPGRSNSLSDK